jgi:hypothetical protein
LDIKSPHRGRIIPFGYFYYIENKKTVNYPHSTGPAHYIHCGGFSEYVEPKNTEKDQKINHEPTPTIRTCCPKSWNYEFVVFVRFVVEKIGDKML